MNKTDNCPIVSESLKYLNSIGNVTIDILEKNFKAITFKEGENRIAERIVFLFKKYKKGNVTNEEILALSAIIRQMGMGYVSIANDQLY